MSAPVLRVLEVTARMAPDSGGIETHVYEVTRRLVEDPTVEVSVLTTDRSHRLPRHEVVEGFALERVDAHPQGRDYYVAPGLWRRIVQGDEDLVHLQGVHSAVPVLAALACIRARRPFLVTLHTGGHSSTSRHRLRSLQWRVLGPLLRRARLVIGVSEHEAALFTELARLDPARVRVIRNGGALPEVPQDAVPSDATDPVLLSLGRLERYKGHHRLIEALPHVRRTHPTARVVVLGRGPYEEELHDLAARLGVEDAVEIAFVEGEDRTGMARRLVGASVVALLSDYEAHPVAVMEALTLRRPVLVARTSGLVELEQAGLVRAVAADAGPEDVAAALVRQLEDPLLPPDGFTLPTWDDCAAALADAYREAAAR